MDMSIEVCSVYRCDVKIYNRQKHTYKKEYDDYTTFVCSFHNAHYKEGEK